MAYKPTQPKPFSEDWYKMKVEEHEMLSVCLEEAITYAGYRIVTAIGIMLIIVGLLYKLFGVINA